MADFIDCTNNQLSDEQLLGALLTKTSGGEWAIRTMYVTACELDAIDCTNNHYTVSDMLRKCIGIDPGCGKPALRLQAPD